MPGWWWSATTGGHVVFESWVERHHIMEFDRAPEVIGLAGQPFALVWAERLKRRSHVPGLLRALQRRSGRGGRLPAGGSGRREVL